LPGDIADWRNMIAVGGSNVRGYLATGDTAFLGGAPWREIPYFDRVRLTEILKTPEVRSALPPELLSRAPPSTWVEAFKRVFLRGSFLWLGLGIALLGVAFAWRSLARVTGGGRRAADQIS
jgi:hypothetical protein